MGRRLSEPTCCRWTPSDECGSDTTEGCSMLHEYLETKTTTHEFAAVETCLGGNDHSNFKASFDGTDGNVSLSYGISQVTSFKTPLKVWHAQSCSSTPPTLSLQLNTVADGTFTVASMNAVAAGQVGFGSAAAFAPQISASIIKADDLMGLSLRLAAMAISHQVVTFHSSGREVLGHQLWGEGENAHVRVPWISQLEVVLDGAVPRQSLGPGLHP